MDWTSQVAKEKMFHSFTRVCPVTLTVSIVGSLGRGVHVRMSGVKILVCSCSGGEVSPNPKPVIAFALTGTQWKVWLRTQWLKNPLSTKYWVPVSRTTTPMSWRGCIFFCDFLRKNISQGSQVLRMITNKVHTSTPPTNKPLASYVSHIHWDDRGTGTPKDRDEVYYEELITRLCCVLARS